MATLDKITSIPQIWGGLLAAFIAILGVRITYPIANTVLGFFDTGLMYYTAVFIMWFMYFTVVWVFTWMIMFQKKESGGNN